MPYDSFKHHRRSIRLKGYDYTQPGAYFITIVAHRRLYLFGEIIDGVMRLNDYGEIARAEWLKTPSIRPKIALDEFQIMPNHFHAIVMIMDFGNPVGAQRRCAPADSSKLIVFPNSIGAIIRAYKSAVTYHINHTRHIPGAPVWQCNYHDHIVRNEDELRRIRKYIRNNPLRWDIDKENK